MSTYIEVLKTWKKKHFCPFCSELKENIIEEKEYFYVIPARAQYCEDHILIVPKRHVCLLKSLKHKELIQMINLVDKRDKKLRKNHKNISLLLRDGLSKEKIGKSINHLHFHLIPNHSVYIMNNEDANNRIFYNDKQYQKLANKIKEKYK